MKKSSTVAIVLLSGLKKKIKLIKSTVINKKLKRCYLIKESFS